MPYLTEREIHIKEALKVKLLEAERDEARAEVERLMQIIELHKYTATERDEALKELEYLKKNAVTLPHRIGTTIIDRDEHGEYYMIQCATEQAAQRRMERGD